MEPSNARFEERGDVDKDGGARTSVWGDDDVYPVLEVETNAPDRSVLKL